MISHAVTVFTSAFLLFLIQPIIARWILPWFGGTPGVWSTCMLVFQTLLLGGYAYADGLVRRVPARLQTWAHLTLLCLSLLLLPVIPDGSWKPSGGEDPTLRILGLLVASIGLPFFLLASTGPLVQAWYARTVSGRSPYRLYALSNAGSMLALLGYPVVVEPLLAASRQALVWSAAYVIFAVLSTWAALRSRPASVAAEIDREPPAARATSPVPWTLLLFWIVLAACASVLLLAVTNQMTQNLAPIPFLWVLPLSIYLASFILCFESDRWYDRRWYFRAFLVAAGGITYCQAVSTGFPVAPAIVVYSLGLFICCMVCHGELVRLRPVAERLTLFYLMISVGGALGGLFVALLAPRLFADYYELPIGLLGCAALVLLARYREVAPMLAPVSARRQRAALAFTLLVIAAALWLQATDTSRNARTLVRNFYGTLRVREVADANGTNRKRLLEHGATCHGLQFLDEERRYLPTAYYTPASGVGLAIGHHVASRSRRVGLIGLGVGTLAAYGRPGDVFRFYEINPLVVALARSQFTFLADSRAEIDVVVGDARLELEREESQLYDVLAVDAFSSDAIPVHLLTREAFALYFRHLHPDGVIAVHVSNKYLDLRPVVEAAAAAFGKHSLRVRSEETEREGGFDSEWVLVSASAATLDAIDPKRQYAAARPAALTLWTDDYSNLFRTLK